MTSRAHDKTKEAAEDRLPVCLVIPCQAEYVCLCRLLAGVVGARGSMNAEDIADLKLVVTEACACFLPGSDDEISLGPSQTKDDAPGSLRVEFRVLSDSWEVTVSDADHRYALSEESLYLPESLGGLGLTIMRALVDHVEHTHAQTGGSILRLSKQIETQTGYLQ